MKKECVHHIVYSTKGGCGKTAFSLCLSYTNLNKFIEEIFSTETQSQINYNYYLDLDFLGTSILECLPISHEAQNNCTTMQDLIFNRRAIDSIIELTDEAAQKNEMVDSNNNVKFFAIPSAIDQKEKNNFQVKRKHTPLLRYDEFRYEINAIISYIEILTSAKQLNNNYNLNFIFDLPPNSDGYTEAFFEEIFKKTNDEKANNKIILYILYNNDAMLTSNLKWLKIFISENKNRRCKIVLVYTDNLKSTKQEDSEALCQMIKETYKITEYDIYYYRFEYKEEIANLYNYKEKLDITDLGKNLKLKSEPIIKL